jgi:hypothetical protein
MLKKAWAVWKGGTIDAAHAVEAAPSFGGTMMVSSASMVARSWIG